MFKSISQIYAEEVKSLPMTKYGRPDPLATSRIKAELHVRFWRPIAEMLDPRDRYCEPAAPAQDFYSRCRVMLPYEMAESLVLMKQYLGVPRLTFGTWFRLRPIFQELLNGALTHSDMDLVACAVREFVRLDLGQVADPLYGTNTVGETAGDQLNDENWCQEDEVGLAIMAAEKYYDHWGVSENNKYVRTEASHRCFDDPAVFEKMFPRMLERRPHMAHALRPIFDRDWVRDIVLIDASVRYAKALLACPFEEYRLASKSVGNLVDAV